jgi:hypothetical protein
MNYPKYLRSDHWRTLSAAKVEDVGFRCERCKRRTQLEVHHMTYERLGAERLSDLRVLCRSCHEKHHASELEFKAGSVTQLNRPLCPRELAREKVLEHHGRFEPLKAELDAARAVFNWTRVREIEAELKGLIPQRVKAKKRKPKKPSRSTEPATPARSAAPAPRA